MIKAFTLEDLSRTAHLQPDGWQDIRPFLRYYVSAPYCRAYKVEDGQGIVALGAFILHASTAWLAHIIVAPEMRRKGLGVMMTRHLIDSCEELGRDTQLLIATKMGEPLYQQLGFQRSCDYRFYHSPPRIEDEPPGEVRRVEPADIPEILALDAETSGEDRRNSLAAHTADGLVYPGTGGGRLRGYYLPSLSEGLVVARDAEAGQALMRLRLSRAEAAPVLPAGNRVANRWLGEMGLGVKHTAARMVRNGADPLKPDMLFNRIGGHLG